MALCLYCSSACSKHTLPAIFTFRILCWCDPFISDSSFYALVMHQEEQVDKRSPGVAACPKCICKAMAHYASIWCGQQN